MVARVELRLIQKEHLRVAPVSAKRLRHRISRAEELRENLRVGRRDRIIGIDEIEGDLPGVGVNRHLDAVPYVVHHARLGSHRLGIGIVLAMGIGVEQPDDPSVHDHRVGILIIPEHRRNRLSSITKRSIEEDTAVGGERRRKQQLRAAEARRQQRTAQQTSQAYAIRPLIARVRIGVTLREIKLVLRRVHHGVIVSPLSEIDLGPVDLQHSLRADGRDVTNDQLG